jgi:parallel beta-helix repeat protein
MRATTFFVVAFLIAFATARAETRTIADFGGKADGVTDNGPALRAAFVYAAAHPGTTLQLGGVCRVKTPAPMNGPVDDRHRSTVAFGKGMESFTIEDGEILLGGPFAAFSFEKCPGLTLRRVSFDYDPPILSQGSIVATNKAARTMTLTPDPGYPSPGNENFPSRDDTWLTVHKPDGEPAFFFVGYIDSSTKDAQGRTTLTYDRSDLAAAIEGVPDLRYVRVQRAIGHLLIFQFCDRLRLEDCSIYGTSAFAGLFLFCNDVVLSGNRICPRPGSGRLVSTCADGFHFIGARRGPQIENNLFDRLEDDNIVISLRGNRIVSTSGNQLQLAQSSCTWYEPGDTLEVVTLGESRHRDYKIVSMAPQKNIFAPPVMTLDRPLEGPVVTLAQGSETTLPTLVFNKSWRLDGTLIRHNRFQNTRRYAVFMGAGGVRIEDNTMSNFIGAALLCSHYDMLKGKGAAFPYYPYYFTSDLTVRGNTIVNAFNYGEGGHKLTDSHGGAIDIYDDGRSSIGVGDLHLAHDLDIENNTIQNSGVAGIHLANVSRATVSGNIISNPDRLNQGKRYGIWVEASPEVQVKDNVVTGDGLSAAVETGP